MLDEVGAGADVDRAGRRRARPDARRDLDRDRRRAVAPARRVRVDGRQGCCCSTVNASEKEPPLADVRSPLLLIVVAILAFYLLSSIKILNEYERAVIFRLGKLLPQPKGPGVIFVFAPIDRMVRVSLRTIVMDVPPQDVITRDNVSVKVNAVVYFRVMDPRRAIVEVESYHYATSQLAQTTLRSVLGQVDWTTCCRSGSG